MAELNLNHVMIGSEQPEVLGEFYGRVLGRPAEMSEDRWFGWRIGSGWLSVGHHSEVRGGAREPQRIILNFETSEVREEFDRISGAGARAVKEPYEIEGMWIATFADPDGNYFQLMSPWTGEEASETGS